MKGELGCAPPETKSWLRHCSVVETLYWLPVPKRFRELELEKNSPTCQESEYSVSNGNSNNIKALTEGYKKN